MNQNPAIAQFPVVERESQQSKIESAFCRVTVMTVEAVLSDQFTQRLGDFRRC